MSDRNQLAAIIALLILGVSATLGAVGLAWRGAPIPEPLTALAGVSIGALAAFAAIRTGNGPPKS